MKQYLSITLVIFVLISACRHPVEKIHDVRKKANIYDSIENTELALLDSLDLKKYNDSAKWKLYSIHCDDTAIGKNGIYLSISSLNVKLMNVFVDADTLDLLYFFMENDSTTIKRQLKNGHYITDGIFFKTSINKAISYNRGEAVLVTTDPDSRFVNPLQPDVVSYIQKNQNYLNGWFRKEAQRRKIIE